MNSNSKYYSGKAPKRIHRDTFGKPLPHVTVQMPVYKEGLRGVIEPTVRSVKHAVATYELQGGSANIFINDDGSKSNAGNLPSFLVLTADSATSLG